MEVAIMFGLFKRKKKSNLDFLNDPDFFKTMMHSAAEGQQRANVNQALGSLGIQLPAEESNTQYCIKRTSALTKYIMTRAGTDTSCIEDDDIFTAGVFAFTIGNHLTRIIGAPFEEVTALTVLDLFHEDRPVKQLTEYIRPIIDTYNGLCTSSKIIEAIGQNVAKWINEPTDEQFTKLVSIYKLCRDSIQEAD